VVAFDRFVGGTLVKQSGMTPGPRWLITASRYEPSKIIDGHERLEVFLT
jgi:hypothetical protein